MKTHRRFFRPQSSRAESGSAYIITLLALVVLTILALALALVTQTEVKVGSNERVVNRTFYAADTGLQIGIAEHFAHSDMPTTVILNKISVGAGSTLSTSVADRVTVSPTTTDSLVNHGFSDLSGASVRNPVYQNNYTIVATAQRIAWGGTPDPPADATVLGQKTVTATMLIDPETK
jgi:Tfp pilus assembly protein PilX